MVLNGQEAKTSEIGSKSGTARSPVKSMSGGQMKVAKHEEGPGIEDSAMHIDG